MKRYILILFFALLGFQLKASSPTLASTEPITLDDKNDLLQNPRQLTFTGPRSGEGYFSADGKRMIFQSERYPGNPFYQMYILNLESGKIDRLSPGVGQTTCGWIHPQMKKALWSSTHHDLQSTEKQKQELEKRKNPVKSKYAWNFDDQFDIYESDLKGKNLKKLTTDKGYEAEASYSPDGLWIAYASNAHAYKEKLNEEEKQLFEKDPSSQMEIYLMKADGSQKKRLTQSLGYDGGPFFSADGKKITWRRFSKEGSTAEIFTMNLDGSDQKQVTKLKAMSWAPFFHPTGDYIVFATSVLGYSNFELYIVDSEGLRKPVRVTFDDGFDGLASFSPDGQKITWTRRNAKGESQIYIADWDDQKARELLQLDLKSPRAAQLSPEILPGDAKKLIRYLTSDIQGGRATGSEEEKKYTEKLAQLFKEMGLEGGAPKGGFIHEFEFTSGVKMGAKNDLAISNPQKQSLKPLEDFVPLSYSFSGKFANHPVVFAGYGLKVPASDETPAYDSYKNLDVKNKWVLLLQDVPENSSPAMKRQMLQYSRLQHKITVAKNEGAFGVIFASGKNFPENLSQLKFDGTLSENSIPVLKIKTSWLESFLASTNKKLSDYETPSKGDEVLEGLEIPNLQIEAQIDLMIEKSTGRNVIARLPSKSKSAALLIGAHGDHLGRGQQGSSLAKADEINKIHSGADDNASGVAGVFELAHHYAQINKKSPNLIKKDLYFAVWSGEEIGILGSGQFVKDWNSLKKPRFEQAFSAALNMDMIGRLKDKLYIQGVGSAENWTPLAEEVALKSALPITLQEDPYLPTDSMSFYLAGIPSISFFTGVHAEYHSPRDREELINYPGLMKVLEVVNSMTGLLVDSSQKMVTYKKVESKAMGRGEGRSFRIYLGTIPDYSQEGVKGVRISGVSKDSPAEKAGLKEKDIIVEFSGTKIENLYDYVYSLQTARPKVETKIKVKRGDVVQEFTITPMLKE